MENLKVDHPEFQFKEYKVRVLTFMALDLVTSLNRLVEVYNVRESMIENNAAVRQFVVFVSCDLLYPVQVCPTLSQSKVSNADGK